MQFNVRAVTSVEHLWTAHIGFLPYDWEISGPDDDSDYFYLEIYVSSEAFADLEGAFIAGRVDRLGIRLDTTLWVREGDWHEPPSGRVIWHLVPPEKRSDMPIAERGTVSDFGWSEAPPTRAVPAPAVPDDKHPAYKAGAAFADDVIRSARTDAGVGAAPVAKKRGWGFFATAAAIIAACIAVAALRSM